MSVPRVRLDQTGGRTSNVLDDKVENLANLRGPGVGSRVIPAISFRCGVIRLSLGLRLSVEAKQVRHRRRVGSVVQVGGRVVEEVTDRPSETVSCDELLAVEINGSRHLHLGRGFDGLVVRDDVQRHPTESLVGQQDRHIEVGWRRGVGYRASLDVGRGWGGLIILP